MLHSKNTLPWQARGFIVSLFIIPCLAALAQPAGRQIVNQSILWPTIASNMKLSSRTSLFLDIQPRFVANPNTSRATETMQVLLRSHIEFVLKGNLTMAPVGYANIRNQAYGKQPVSTVNNEHRLYQQLAYNHKWGNITVSHRLRSEERFIQDHAQDGSDLGYINKQFRLRYRLMMNYPIHRDKIEPGVFFASTFYEGFVSRGERVTFQDIDQNRLYFGLGYQISKNLNLNAGYLYQMLTKSNGEKQENNIGLLVMVTQNLDLSKKSD